MLEPVKSAFGEFMGRYYAEIVPTTKPLHEYVVRGLAKSMVWAPTRMVDSAEDMLASWQRNDTDTATTTPPKMPVVIVALARDYTPTMRDFTRQIADTEMVIFPGDVKERVFGVKTMAGDIRAQIAFFAQDEPTARSLAAQFLLFLDASGNRRFTARYYFAGQALDHPVQIESPDSPAMSIQSDSKNLTILAVDITLKAQIPLFSAPGVGQPNDGKGTVGDDSDPAGYPLTAQVDIVSKESS
jgi:hypothetical protein